MKDTASRHKLTKVARLPSYKQRCRGSLMRHVNHSSGELSDASSSAVEASRSALCSSPGEGKIRIALTLAAGNIPKLKFPPMHFRLGTLPIGFLLTSEFGYCQNDTLFYLLSTLQRNKIKIGYLHFPCLFYTYGSHLVPPTLVFTDYPI